jgi:hypothetical protein
MAAFSLGKSFQPVEKSHQGQVNNSDCCESLITQESAGEQ